MDFSKLDGLIPAVVQDDRSGEVLMVGFMNEEALARTRDTGFATFFSRTRGALWTKGETSGNRLKVLRILQDCDEDTVLLKVTPLGDGNVCHTGERSCFFRELSPPAVREDTRTGMPPRRDQAVREDTRTGMPPGREQAVQEDKRRGMPPGGKQAAREDER